LRYILKILYFWPFKMNRCSNKYGFTLIELSIVLIIIGLITGGTLVGRDLIHAAEIRSTISQVEKFNTAVNTFRGKYGYLPGDMPPTIATSFGFFAFTGANAGTTGYGDGNEVVDVVVASCTHESLVFWRHLSDAQLIGGSYGQTTPTNAIDPTSGNVSNTISGDVSPFLPTAKIGAPAYFVAQDFTDGILGDRTLTHNYYALYSITSLNPTPSGCGITGHTVTPIDGKNMDTKLDDGMPFTGRVTSNGDWSGVGCVTGGSGAGDPSAVYNADPGAGGNGKACDMFFSFN
jgi:prepilin-type N-terminal cleavage/methylation domain-containing protein